MRGVIAALLFLLATPAWAEAPQKDAVRAQIMDDIQKKVSAAWVLPEGLSVDELEVAVGIKLDVNGHVTDAGITKSSGNKHVDASLMRAVKKASPLPIPAEHFSAFERIELFFNGQMN